MSIAQVTAPATRVYFKLIHPTLQIYYKPFLSLQFFAPVSSQDPSPFCSRSCPFASSYPVDVSPVFFCPTLVVWYIFVDLLPSASSHVLSIPLLSALVRARYCKAPRLVTVVHAPAFPSIVVSRSGAVSAPPDVCDLALVFLSIAETCWIREAYIWQSQ